MTNIELLELEIDPTNPEDLSVIYSDEQLMQIRQEASEIEMDRLEREAETASFIQKISEIPGGWAERLANARRDGKVIA